MSGPGSPADRRTAFRQRGKGGQRSVRMGTGRGRAGPDERKFEQDTAEINRNIKELENKLKPINTTQHILAEMTKENAQLADIEKEKETNTSEIKATDAKIREIGVEYMKKKAVANDLLTGVRHKTASRYDDAVERLEQQILIRRCSSVEEMKFRHEIDALKKSKERLFEYNAAKSVVDVLKKEQEECRSQRDRLHRQTKELRAQDISQKDKVAQLKVELEEAKERKKVGNSDREEIRREIDALHKKRRELFNLFRSEQLAFSAQLRQQSEEDRVQRDMNRAIWEERRKYRAIEQTFQYEQQYVERIMTGKALVSHLQRLSLTNNSHTGLPDMDNADPSPPTSSTNLDPVPRRSESEPITTSSGPGGFILRRERDEVLVPPTTITLKRKKSKKEKRRNVPVISKKLNLNPTIFRQFESLDLDPPSTLADIPHVISLLQDKLTYFEGMTKAQLPFALLDVMIPADSGLGSTAPSEMLDYETTDLTNSQEEMTLDPGLGSTVSPRRSISEVIANGTSKLPPIAALPQRSATDHMKVTEPAAAPSSDEAIVRLYDSVLPHNLVSMVSSSTNASSSDTSIAVHVGTSDE